MANPTPATAAGGPAGSTGAPGTGAASASGTVAVPRTLTTWKVIVLIIAAMTPLSAVVGTLPLGMAFGGPSITWAFILSGIVIGIFCIGYSKMVQRINRPGAFYNYIARGLGRPAGVGAAMIAAIGYPVGFMAVLAVQSIVTVDIVRATFGAEVPWQVIMVVLAVLVLALTWWRIDFSATFVLVIVAIEVALILALVVGIVARLGADAFPIGAISFDAFSIGQWTVAFIFAILCFQGYEAGAMYAPEAKRPERTIPRALFGALILLVVLYVLATWTLTGAAGVETLMDTVLEQELTGFIFATVADYLGPAGLWLFSIATLLAQLACTIAVANFMSRYLQSLAAERLLPRPLAWKNRNNAPGAALITLIVGGAIVVLVLSALGADPYTQIASVGFGVGALVATVLQALASAAVVAYFLKLPASQRNVFTTFIAPVVATVLLVIALIIQLTGFTWITGSEEPWIAAIPWVLLALLVLGVGFGFWLRSGRPHIYEHLASGDSAEEALERQVQRDTAKLGAVSGAGSSSSVSGPDARG